MGVCVLSIYVKLISYACRPVIVVSFVAASFPPEEILIVIILENATALGSRIPPHAVLLQVNDNTPVKLKIIFAI